MIRVILSIAAMSSVNMLIFIMLSAAKVSEIMLSVIMRKGLC
jgi:hypothetical protein